MRIILFLLFAGSYGLLRAETNSVVPESSEQEIGLHAGQFYFDGNARQFVYFNGVVVTNLQGKLTCERLTINLVPEGSGNSHPTNAVAETNVVVLFVNKGETNRITADKAIYAYSVENSITNQTLTFTGHARAENSQGWATAEPLIWDNIARRITGPGLESHFKIPSKPSNDTNAAPVKPF